MHIGIYGAKSVSSFLLCYSYIYHLGGVSSQVLFFLCMNILEPLTVCVWNTTDKYCTISMQFDLMSTTLSNILPILEVIYRYQIKT